ncbi:hypothetical protein E3P99_01116 [Wallemia hederae]|uniref:Cyclin-dependent kinase 8 n=1 Tax=Wallemia hederae TaxID=1540922 RepID=A0A4T0FSB2_9BASI|nr:hypothetical protein E3P99_01116 [Wallemia hederae]
MTPDLNAVYNSKKAKSNKNSLSQYKILGFLSSGTYGKVFKAESINDSSKVYAIKKFKPDNQQYMGISQSAIREMSLNREIKHDNLAQLVQVLLIDGAIYMIFEYAEHDLLQIIYHHSQVIRKDMSPVIIKSFLFQLLNGVHYLHSNYIIHRDLKPANILITNTGLVKVGDLGLARVYKAPLQPLYNGDKVVVTIWYRSPELLLGTRHYTPSIDMWAIGCIYAEMLSLRPLFKGEEARIDNKKLPFQSHQMVCIMELLGWPSPNRYPDMKHLPEYNQLSQFKHSQFTYKLNSWFGQRSNSLQGFDLLDKMLQYDPTSRITALSALNHPFFHNEQPMPISQPLILHDTIYPTRRVTQDDELNGSVHSHNSAASNANATTTTTQPRKRSRLI